MRKIYLLLVLTFFSVVSFSQVSVTATSGTAGPTSYTTVSAAFAAINAGTHKGAVTITISANTTEPVSPTALLKSASPSDYTSVLIKPSGNVAVNSPATPSSNRGIIELSGADNVTIDGDDPSTSGSRNLSIVSATSSSTSVFACIRVSSNSTTGADGADNITIKNCIITGSRSSATQTSSSSSSGINLSNYSTTSLTTGAYSNLNNIFENNLITRTMWGILANGASTSYPNTGLIIRNNVLGSSTSSNNLGRGGISVTYSSATASGNSALIEGTDISVGDVSPSGSGYALSIAGIDLGTVNAGAIIRKNNIHDIYQPTTSGYGAYGINISGSTNCQDIEISNNFLTNIVAAKYSTTTSTFTAFGIRYAAGATLQKILHNTIVLPAAVNGSIANYSNFGIYAVSTATFSKFLNNIIVNNNVGTGTYGFYTSATTNISGGSVDNNDYYVPNGYLGVYNGFAYSTISGWRSATSQEANSLNIEPTFVSSTDFHLNYGTTPSQLESAGATVSSTGINVDFDGQLRPGPSGSVNGGAVYPDIGADEVDAVPLDANPPTISYTPISNACNVGALTLTATITDLFGVPTSGSGLPRIYWKLNSGAWSSTQGTSIGSNQYSFTFAGTAVAGDRVSYYVVAQDNSSNVSVLPSSGAGSFTTSPPAAGTPPTSPYTFVMGGMSGTYTIGSASGSNYTRLTDAISDYNSSCLTGPVIFELLDATYSVTANSESFPLTINSNSSASATNTLTIRPASGVSVLISGTVNSNGLFRILGSYVTVNGSNNSSTTRDLTLQNLGATNPRVVIVGSTSTTPITNVIIRNTVIENGSNSQTSAQGVLVSSSGGAAGYFNNISIVNNSFVKTYYGVYSTAVSASGNGSGLLIQNNLMNNSGANSIGYSAVYLLGVDGYEVSGNSIGNIETTANNPTGIYIGSNSINGEISKNNISNVAYTGTDGYGGKGIWLLPSNSTANTVIRNNFISDIKGDGWNTFASDAIIGISVANSGSAGGVSVYNNSVNLGSGAFTGYNNGTLSSAFYVGSSATGLDIRNNIFTNNLVNSSNSTAKSYSFYSAAPSSAYTAIDNNCYGVAGSQGVLANLGSDLNTLAAIIAVGGNQNSQQSYPSFASSTNLHLTSAAGDNWCLESAGTPISSVTTDIDGDTRDAARPDIGADEFAATGFTITNPSAVCAPSTVDLTAAAVTAGTLSGATFSYFTNVTGTTALSTPTAVAASGTYYIKATNGSCSWIKPVTVTINPQPTPSITGS
ncbi:MAG: beta strand repeat-containing protein, partial [Bacteroidota bacterium]